MSPAAPSSRVEETPAFSGRLSGLPIQLRVLERYAIENYFPQHTLEKIIGTDLTPFFPIIAHISALEQLSKNPQQFEIAWLEISLRRLR
jgi:hypothetical protein